MAKATIKVDARTFYLNEQHELARGERNGRGGHPKLGAIDWVRKGQTFKTNCFNLSRRPTRPLHANSAARVWDWRFVASLSS